MILDLEQCGIEKISDCETDAIIYESIGLAAPPSIASRNRFNHTLTLYVNGDETPLGMNPIHNPTEDTG